jgi:hypothetical protein
MLGTRVLGYEDLGLGSVGTCRLRSCTYIASRTSLTMNVHNVSRISYTEFALLEY